MSYDQRMGSEITYEIISAVPVPDVVAWQRLEDGTYERLVGPVILRTVRYHNDLDDDHFSVLLNGDPGDGWIPEPYEARIAGGSGVIFLPRDQKPVNS